MNSLVVTVMGLVLVQASATPATRPAQSAAASRPSALSVEQALSALGADVEHYLAESEIRTPSGQPAGRAVVLTRRALIQREATILDQTTTLTGHLPVHDELAIMKVEGDQVVIRERANLFNGKGTLTGPPWAWTGLTYSLSLATGGAVDVSVDYTPEGYVARRAYRGSDGAPRLVFEDRARRISKDTYEVLRANLREPAAVAPTTRPTAQTRPMPPRTAPARQP